MLGKVEAAIEYLERHAVPSQILSSRGHDRVDGFLWLNRSVF